MGGPVAALRFYRSDAHPTLTDKARMFQRHTKREDRKKPDRGKAFSARRSRRSVRSGYAFAHQRIWKAYYIWSYYEARPARKPSIAKLSHFHDTSHPKNTNDFTVETKTIHYISSRGKHCSRTVE